MLTINPESKSEWVERAAELLCAAARTAPKGRGRDLLVTAVVSGVELGRLADTMRMIAERDQVAFFGRDAGNLSLASAVVLIGTRKEPLGLPHCGYCGFADCAAMQAAGAVCAGDGVTVGGAAASAAFAVGIPRVAPSSTAIAYQEKPGETPVNE